MRPSDNLTCGPAHAVRHPAACTVTNQHRTAVTGVSVTEANCVFCQFGIQVSCTVWAVTRAVAPAVGRRPLTAMSVHVGFVANRWHCDMLFCPFFCFLCQYHSTNVVVHLRVQVALTRRTKGGSMGTAKQSAIRDEVWKGKPFHIVSCFLVTHTTQLF